MGSYRLRRTIIVIIFLLIAATPLASMTINLPTLKEILAPEPLNDSQLPAELSELIVKGRAPKTGYERSQFGSGWDTSLGCDVRNIILARDLKAIERDERCRVISGTLTDPYTGTTISFIRGETTSDDVQIDHVVALSNAWQTGAQQLDYGSRVRFANDPLNLLAVDGAANEQKSDSDAASWLPSSKQFRCQYINRQIAVKKKYELWVTLSERDAMARVLNAC